jgi:tetratricopeptide (TPR) repeat protein
MVRQTLKRVAAGACRFAILGTFMGTLLGALMGAVPVAAAETPDPQTIRKAYFDSYDLEAKERFADAIAALRPVQQAFPNTYTVNYRSGWLAYRNKSWAESIKYYDKALAAYPNSLEAHTGRIKVDVARQDWKAVAEQCGRVMQIDYNNSAANYWLIVAEQALGNRSAARKNALRMLALYPTSTDFLVELGKIQYLEGQLPQAIETFDGVQVLDPYNQSASYYLNLLKASAKK